MKILIITGGSSSERKISFISARMVKKGLVANGHAVTLFDYKKGKDALRAMLGRFDAVFPVMHGKEGEDGELYGLLKKARAKYVGSDPKGAKIAFDKVLFKQYCDRKGILTAAWRRVKNSRDLKKFGFPCVLKAASGGSSHEVAILVSEKDLKARKTSAILKLRDAIFAERLVRGPEITVGVLAGKTLPVMEIVPPEEGWFDYRNKYSGKTKELPFAPSLSAAARKQAQAIALRIHRDLKLGAYSRADFIVENGKPVILETNTPGGVGMTPESLLPKSAQAVGISFDELVEKILRNSLGQ